MNRSQILKRVKKRFKIHELVGRFTYRIHGERSWKFFSTDALYALLIIRDNINRPMTINNWYWGGKFSQRGLRTNLQNLFRQMFLSRRLYLSGHVLGEAFDFDVKGMTPMQVRKWIVANQNLFPMKLRLENKKNGKQINWVHVDVIHEEKNPKVYLFDV